MKCGTKEMCKRLIAQKEKERKKNNAVLISFMNLLDAGFTKEFANSIMTNLVDDMNIPIKVVDCISLYEAYNKIKKSII